MRTHEVFLQVHELFVTDMNVREFAESGIDSVDVVPAGNDFSDVLGGLGNRLARLDSE